MAVRTQSDAVVDMVVTTWQLRFDAIVDQIFGTTPFYLLMKKKGRIESKGGGRYIEEPLQYAKNETVTSIAKGDSVTLKNSESLTTSYWDWKTIVGHIMVLRDDMSKNAGPEKIKDLVKVKLDNLVDTIVDTFETMLFADGTGNDSKDIDGLGNIVASAPTTGSPGGINRATYTWWRNQTYNMTAQSVTVYLIQRMRNMYNTCGAQNKGVSRFPDAIITDQTGYEYFEAETDEMSRILVGDKDLVSLGFGELAYKGKPITWSPACTAGSMYFLNMNTLRLVRHSTEFLEMGERIPILDQPKDSVIHNVSTLNLVSGKPAANGILYNIGL